MRLPQSHSLARYFVSSAISYALVILLCAPCPSLLAASRTGSTRDNVSPARDQGRPHNGEPIDVTAFTGRHIGKYWEAGSYRFLHLSNTLKVSANKLFRYGLDKDNVPFAQRADGTKGRFVNLSSDHFRLQISKGRRHGEVEFIRLSDDETVTQFKTGGDSLL